MSYSEDGLYHTNWTIVYFHVLSSLTFYMAYVLVSIDWKPLNGKRLVFSTCIFHHSEFIEGTHKFMFICWSSVTGFEKERNGKNFKKEKLAYRTKGKFNEIWIIYIQILFMNSPWHLESLFWFSLPCFFSKSPSSVVIWYVLWECKLFL